MGKRKNKFMHLEKRFNLIISGELKKIVANAPSLNQQMLRYHFQEATSFLKSNRPGQLNIEQRTINAPMKEALGFVCFRLHRAFQFAFSLTLVSQF